MGTYLSIPVTEKTEESGESIAAAGGGTNNNATTGTTASQSSNGNFNNVDHPSPTPTTPAPALDLAWGVVDMQGWRKSMEDAHVATGQDGVFAVFDGHGGPEVARFCQLYLVSVLQQQAGWTNNHNDENDSSLDHPPPATPSDTPVGQALVSAFHALDRMIADPDRRYDDTPPSRSRPKESFAPPSPLLHRSLTTPVLSLFLSCARPLSLTHAHSNSLLPRFREELIRLRAIKPSPGHRQIAHSIPPVPSSSSSPNICNSEVVAAPPPTAETPDGMMATPEQASPVTSDAAPPPFASLNPSPDAGMAALPAGGGGVVGAQTPPGQPGGPSDCLEDGDCDMADASADSPEIDNEDDEDIADAPKDDDSIEAVGHDEAALEHELEDVDGDHEMESAHPPGHSPSRYSVMFQRLLNMSAPSGQLVVQLTGGASPQLGANNAITTTNPAAVASPSASTPSLLRNGRLICNLPDHPIHAGATAIVAVLVGHTLTVANAGDSRAVLCRRGIAHALSLDHKPLDERELTRIRRAGGFVNQFGRVNGNLNLSRSIGDLKYKQVPHLSPSEQMITAEPDIVQ